MSAATPAWLITQRADLLIYCDHCNNAAQRSPADLPPHLLDCPLPRLGRAFRCSRCGRREARVHPRYPAQSGGYDAMRSAAHRWSKD